MVIDQKPPTEKEETSTKVNDLAKSYLIDDECRETQAEHPELLKAASELEMSIDEFKASQIDSSETSLVRLFVCPITLQQIETPVITPDGNVFEKATIEKWVSIHSTCPLTKKPLQLSDIKLAAFSEEISSFS